MSFAKTMRLNSLSLKVLLAYVIGVTLSIMLFVIGAVVANRTDVSQLDLSDLAQDMTTKVKFDGAGKPVATEVTDDALAWLYENFPDDVAYRILDDGGAVVLISNADTAFWPEAQVGLTPGPFRYERNGIPMQGATALITQPTRTWYMQTAASERLVRLFQQAAWPLIGRGIIAFSTVLFVVFGICAYFTIRVTLRPLRAVSEAAAAISPRSLHARLEAGSVPSEIRPFVESFNRVLERVEAGYRVQQEFLATAAHELKTPLALLRGQIELQDDNADRAALLSDIEYMSRQVQQLLLLAEASEAHNYALTEVHMRDAALDVASYLQRMAEAADVRITVAESPEDVTWQADRGALFTLLKNLLENALQHAPPATSVTVEIRPDTLTVRDVGPGVDEAQLPLLFARFWRGAHRRDQGAGLGLAICQEIALAHGWTLTAERAAPGLCFLVTNPAAR